jgi:hypothetical protein
VLTSAACSTQIPLLSIRSSFLIIVSPNSWFIDQILLIISLFSNFIAGNYLASESQRNRTMQMLKDDNEHHFQLGFQLDTYGMDLSEYVFPD